MPNAWQGILLALAAFRLTRLLGWDDLTVGFRTWLCGLSDDDYDAVAKFVYEVQASGRDPWADNLPPEAQLPITPGRFYVAKLIHCPWCAGWWISLGVALCWWIGDDATLVASLPLAISAAVGLIARNLDP